MENLRKYLVSDVKLSYHPKVKPSERPQIKHPREAYEMILQKWNTDTIMLREEFKIILLDRRCKVLCIHDLSIGTRTETLVDPGIIMAIAIGSLAKVVILVHNHPSGDIQPSEADKNVTQNLVAGAKYLNITVSDHLIISPEGYYSMAENGII